MKWIFYVIVFFYMFYRAVYGLKTIQKESRGLTVEPIAYGDKNYYNAGIRKSIICKGTNKNQKVEWIDPAGNVVKRVNSNRVFAQEHFVPAFRNRIPAVVLVFTHAIVDDTGIWECRSGDLSDHVSLCIMDPSEFVDTPTEVTVDRGRSITLSCHATGEPEPRLIWYRNGETITDNIDSSKYQIMIKYNSQGFEGLLTITSLEAEDSGVYSCDAVQESPKVDNCIATKSVNITLLVNYGPTFPDGNDTTLVPGIENENVDLVCDADAHPKPTYRWFKEDGDVLTEYSKDDIKLIDNGAKAVLTLAANASTFGQRYRCRSSNRYGEIDKVFVVIRLEEPTRPKISLENATHDSLYLKLKWDGEVLFPVDEVLIQYIKKKNLLKKKLETLTDVDWKKSDEYAVKTDGYDVSDGEGSGLMVTLGDLKDETEYWIRIRAINEAGESPWSQSIRASTIELPEAEIAEEVGDEEQKPVTAAQISDGTFYGVFFAGGILVVGVGCMFAMRMV